MAEDRDSDILRERLHRLMTIRQIRTPSELARRAGISSGGFLMFWRGETSTPREGTLQRLADALHVSLGVLQGEEPGPAVEDVASVEIVMDGDDLDVFQAIASIRRLSTVEVIEGQLAVAAKSYEDDPAIQAVLRTLRDARQGRQSGSG